VPAAGVLAIIGGVGTGLVGTAFGFGFRHGIDWDHIAALTDLAGSVPSQRRALRLASLYALGHALVVLVLGCAAILGAEQLPPGVDGIMERFVGLTLVLLAIYVGWSLLRKGRGFRMRSRWTLLLAGVRHLRRRATQPDAVIIEHSHPHDHARHEHVHIGSPVGSPTSDLARGPDATHSHPHVHVGHLPEDPSASYSALAAFGIGMLHGVGAETPTQVLLFVAAAGAGGRGAGVVLLLAFVVGLLCSNTVVAVVATFGALGAAKRWWLTVTVSSLTAVASLVIGVLLLTGNSTVLPTLFTG
jgi:high-affinity nickel-transport protein